MGAHSYFCPIGMAVKRLFQEAISDMRLRCEQGNLAIYGSDGFVKMGDFNGHLGYDVEKGRMKAVCDGLKPWL